MSTPERARLGMRYIGRGAKAAAEEEEEEEEAVAAAE
jgi:hypothetical protein